MTLPLKATAARRLFWFTDDLRIDALRSFEALPEAGSAMWVFVVEQRCFKTLSFNTPSMGQHRWQFLQESLSHLSRSLHSINQRLTVRYGDTVNQLQELIVCHDINEVVLSRAFGWYEQQQLQTLKNNCKHCRFIEVDNSTLLTYQQIQGYQASLRKGFTPFRKMAEQLSVNKPKAQSPQSQAIQVSTSLTRPTWANLTPSNTPFNGGREAGLQHLYEFMASGAASTYKETRNALDGRFNSTQLSPWLANGCLSPLDIWHAVEQYENNKEANDSTYWIKFELLWREYFRWLALDLGPKLYRFKGLRATAPLTSFYGNRYKQWCEGNTPYPLVNAIMQELKMTGFISNRSRQIAASCFINELAMDWRYGAAWFEHQLVDYDPAANWGNWSYIAGVGVDPRGGRHFNLEKQTHMFDPTGDYQRKWSTNQPPMSHIDTVDIVDWPITP